jgi:hypothetical protein
VRGDYFQYAKGRAARGYEAVAGFPFENSIFLLSYNHLSSDLNGMRDESSAEWKFVF